MEFYGFLHFTVNTFTDKEWGYGDEDEKVFNPTDFDADQIVSVAKQAGMKGLILTAKHHDGFCLWPSRYTEHSVKNSPWKGGQGDVVQGNLCSLPTPGIEVRRISLALGPQSQRLRPARIRHLLPQSVAGTADEYGDIFTVWFDGANGGDGFYGGAREKRQIDNRTYYDWEHTWQIVRELMPGAVMFSDGGPGFPLGGQRRAASPAIPAGRR